MSLDQQGWNSLAREARELAVAGKLWDSLHKWEEIRAARDTSFAARQYGYVAHKLGFLEKALNAALEGLALDPTNRGCENQHLYCLAGLTELKQNDLDGRKEHLEHARSHFINALNIDERARYHVFLGSVHMRLNEMPAAETCFRKVLALEPFHEEAMYNLAEIIRWTRDDSAPAEAVELYRKAIAIDPQFAQAYRGLAMIFFDSEQYEEAEDHARLALKFDPSEWGAHVLIGDLLLRKGQIRAARKSLERGAELAPFKWWAQSSLARFYDKRGSLSDAQRLFRRCLEIDPDNPWANRRFGAVLASLEKPTEARIFLKRALALNPSDKLASEYLETLDKMYPHRPRKRHPSASKRKSHNRE